SRRACTPLRAAPAQPGAGADVELLHERAGGALAGHPKPVPFDDALHRAVERAWLDQARSNTQRDLARELRRVARELRGVAPGQRELAPELRAVAHELLDLEDEPAEPTAWLLDARKQRDPPL